MAAAHADAWNASSVVWLREVGLDGAREARDRYEDAGADTLIFVLDEERDPDTIPRLASAAGVR